MNKDKLLDILAYKVDNNEITLECAQDIYMESLKTKIGEISRKYKDSKIINKKFNMPVNIIKHKEKTIKSFQEQNRNIKDWLEKMSTVDKFSTYKTYFTKLSNLFGVHPTIIYKVSFNDEDNSVTMKYEDIDEDYIVPKDAKISHISPNEFGELIPSFRSKSIGGNAKRGGYFYSSPRIYCFVSPEKSKIESMMYKNAADLKSNTKINKYELPDNVRTVKVDPSIRNTLKTGASYIETNYPIKVKKVNK